MQAAFYKGTRPGLNGMYSRAVRLVDRGPYSHCEVVFSKGLSGSASWVDGGVRLKSIDYRQHPENWDFFPLPGHLEAKVWEWFCTHAGEGYDLPGNLRFVSWMVRESPSNWFCSEAYCTSLGIPEPWRFGPNGAASLTRFLFPSFAPNP